VINLICEYISYYIIDNIHKKKYTISNVLCIIVIKYNINYEKIYDLKSTMYDNNKI